MKLGICCTDALGWRVVRKRWAKCFPEAKFYNPEDHGNPYLKRGLRTFAKQWAMRKAVLAAHADGCDRIIVASNGEAGFVPRRIAEKVAIYGDASHRQLSDLYRFNRPEAKLKNRESQMSNLAASGAQFVAMSEWCAQGFVRDYGLQQGDVGVIGPPLDLDLIDAAEDLAEDPREGALFIGGDFQRKGGEALLEVARKIPQLAFHVVTTSEVQNAPANVIVHRGLQPESPELLKLLWSAQMFVFPTTADCSPLAVLEAQATELPVIATNVGGLGDMVKSGQHGWLIPPHRVDDLEDAIEDFLSGPAVASDYGVAGRRRVESENSLLAHSRRWRAVLG